MNLEIEKLKEGLRKPLTCLQKSLRSQYLLEMSIPSSIKRVLRLCDDFEFAMPVIAYYTKLYVVEELLALKERNEDVIANATRLMNEIEDFKQSAAGEAEKQLLRDQQKAKVYCMNFAMSLYNEQLNRIQKGAVAPDLSRALWCCADLFGMIQVLWKNTEATSEEVQQCQKRIKICKLYLSKLARGELGKSESEEPKVVARDSDAFLPNLRQTDYESEENEQSPENQAEIDPKEVDSFIKSLEQDPSLIDDDAVEETQQDESRERKDTDELIRKMRELDSDPLPNRSDSEPELNLPQAPTEIGKLPAFIDVDESDTEMTNYKEEQVVKPPLKIPTEVKQKPVHYQAQDLKEMWNREDQIAEVQKTARFAISALNYEDVKTAKQELKKALQLLDEIQ
ncbi:LANO_0G01618g1_1 [Lachancea nothofagi CBS 11611]|uniref:LANO_0G01618g1_1 n=1 Tax=Lachancea nothofagi CBS 11611 TaxID=1266666 RepID=A0A1G4KEX1_9SACH|nr:LANO_0G01618g1_1 [Lachancea nothofagi CBS 11611]